MAFQPAPWIAQLNVQFVDNSTGVFVGQNTLNFRSPGQVNYTTAALQDLVDEFGNNWYQYVRPQTSSQVTMKRVYARDMSMQNGAYYEGTGFAAGSHVLGRTPANVTAALAFRTAQAGRSARGRMFMVGMPLEKIEEDSLEPLYAEALRLAWQNVFTILADQGVHVVLSRYTNGVERPTAVSTPVTTYAWADLRIDTRRSRLRRTTI